MGNRALGCTILFQESDNYVAFQMRSSCARKRKQKSNVQRRYETRSKSRRRSA